MFFALCCSDTSQVMSGRRFSVLTWNVWFEMLHRKTRYNEILDVCAALHPDFICLQEVIPEFMEVLNAHNLSNEYANSGTRWGERGFQYGVVSLSKKALQPRFEFRPLITEMRRNLLITLVDGPTGEICVGNVHLESLDNAEYRADQLKTCRRALEGRALSILCGDFNICSYRNYQPDKTPLEQTSIDTNLAGYRDAWVDVHQQAGVTEENKGYTFDTERNGMLIDHRWERMRYDRIMFSNRTSGTGEFWRPVSVDIIGDRRVGENVPAILGNEAAPIAAPAVNGYSTPPKKERVLFPSDHFGLHAAFEL